MSELTRKANSVQNKESFIDFLSFLINDLDINSAEWENKTLKDYLEAMQSWVEDMEGYYINNQISLPKKIEWKIFADILIASKMYE